MSRSAKSQWLVLAAVTLVLGGYAAPGRAGEDSRTAMAFVDGLRARGMHDLAIEYLNVLRADPTEPDNIKNILDYEEGRR